MHRHVLLPSPCYTTAHGYSPYSSISRPLFQFWGYTSSCCCDYWDHWDRPPLLQLFLVLFYFLVLLLTNVGIPWGLPCQPPLCLELSHCVSHWYLGPSSPFLPQMHLYTTSATWLVLLVCTVLACILHPTTLYCIVSGAPTRVLLAVVDSCLYGSGAYGLFLCFHDQSLCAVLYTGL